MFSLMNVTFIGRNIVHKLLVSRYSQLDKSINILSIVKHK